MQLPSICLSGSAKDHKRKRSFQDSPVEDENGSAACPGSQGSISETEDEVEALMTHVNSLEEIIYNVKKPVRGFLLVVGREGIMADIPVH